jgi:hypothetical protein
MARWALCFGRSLLDALTAPMLSRSGPSGAVLALDLGQSISGGKGGFGAAVSVEGRQMGIAML